MTAKEAISILTEWVDNGTHEFIHEALQLAIKALSQDGDTISRAAAIEAILDLHADHRVSWVDAVIDALETLPSAQPEPSQCWGCNCPKMALRSDIYIEKTAENFTSCGDCIHANDNAEICFARKCIHAVSGLYECYKPKQERYCDWSGNPIFVSVKINDTVFSIKADDLKTALDAAVTEGEKTEISAVKVKDAERRTDGVDS